MTEFDEDEAEVSLERLKEMVDDAPAVRMVDLIVGDAVENQISQVWILAVASCHQFYVLVFKNGAWQQNMSQTWLLLPPLLAALKTRAGLDPHIKGVFGQGTFGVEHQGVACRVELRIMPGEFQDEAHLRINFGETPRRHAAA